MLHFVACPLDVAVQIALPRKLRDIGGPLALLLPANRV